MEKNTMNTPPAYNTLSFSGITLLLLAFGLLLSLAEIFLGRLVIGVGVGT